MLRFLCDGGSVLILASVLIGSAKRSGQSSSLHADEQGTQPFTSESFTKALQGFAALGRHQCDIASQRDPSSSVDLRSCWGNTIDMNDRPVCHDSLLSDLIKESPTLKVKGDSGGKSPATLVFSRDFVIKSATEEDMEHIRKNVKLIPNFVADAGCYGTALSILCGVVRDSNGWWLLNRKITIPESSEKDLNVQLGVNPDRSKRSDVVSGLDLKGPYFWKKDIKSYDWHRFVREQNMVKDWGFQTYYPEGLQLQDCGSREAALAFSHASTLLMNIGSTDYSFFGKVYGRKSTLKDSSKCVCQEKKPPRWPVLMYSRKMIIAAGIIDFWETTFRSDIRKLGTTMLPPKEFRPIFSKIFPQYFVLPKTTRGVDTIVFQPGKSVEALVAMKWSSGKKRGAVTEYAKTLTVFDHGSAVKVYAGHVGKIESVHVQTGFAMVSWCGRASSNSRFKVHLSQIVVSEKTCA